MPRASSADVKSGGGAVCLYLIFFIPLECQLGKIVQVQSDILLMIIN